MRLLVLANETCASVAVLEEVRARMRAVGPIEEVVVVAPVLARSRLTHWLTSDESARDAAQERLDQSVSALTDEGLAARGELGDADPLQALNDAVRVYRPDEVIIATHTPARSQWLERRVVEAARAAFDLPITHVAVDLERETEVGGAIGQATHTGRRAANQTTRFVRLHHHADYSEALEIRNQGFRDHTHAGQSGVLVSNRPDTGDGDPTIFAVDVPEEVAAGFELRGASGDGQTFLVPAELLNRHGPPRILGDDSIE
jgi:hypothetical protein